MKTILGTKGNMTQVFINDHRVVVTKITAGPCVVTQIRNMNKDGYWAIQLGFNQRPAKNTSKSLQGHLKENKKDKLYPRNLREIRLDKEPDSKVGDVINASDIFGKGDVVMVSGITKGKGFQGGVRRYGFAGGPRTHGQSDRERAPGSIGQTTTPGRVYKGKKMAGRMGGTTVTIKNLHVVALDKETNELVISGAIPGKIGALLLIKRISAGSLKDLEKETPVAQVIEGESPAPSEQDTTAKADGQTTEQPKTKPEVANA